MDLTTIEQQLTTAIGQQETSGGTAGVGASLNNAGAIQYSPWEASFGATPTTGSSFATFPSLTSSYAALQQLITNYVNKGASITSLINTYAPPSDGNTNNAARIAQAAAATGLNPTAPINGQTPSNTSAASSAASILSATAGLTNQYTSTGIVGRIAAVGVGAILLIVGLLSLKSTQPIVQTVVKGARDAAGAAAGAA